MTRNSISIVICLLAFLFGLSVCAFWIFQPQIPQVSAPEFTKKDEIPLLEDSESLLKGRKLREKENWVRFNEKPLREVGSSFDENYRFVFYPTFDAPLTIRISGAEGKKILTTKKLSGVGGFGEKKLGRLSYEKTRILTAEENKKFLDLIENSGFWRILSIDNDDEPIEDGAIWVMEGIKNDKYKFVIRITPNQEFRAVCTYLLYLSGLENEYKGY